MRKRARLWVVGTMTAIAVVSLLSVSISPSEAQSRKRPAPLGLSLNTTHTIPTVHAVKPKSTAADLGLKPGDVILVADGVAVKTVKELVAAFQRKTWWAGDRVALKVRRGDRELTLSAKLRPAPSPPSVVGKKAPPWSIARWGNLPKGKKPPTLASLKGKVVVLFCFQSW